MQKSVLKVGIAGLGLIGGSVLKGLAGKKDYEIFAVSNSSYTKAQKFCKNVSANIESLKDCDIIFVCTSIEKTIPTLEKLNAFLDKSTIVADVASVKANLLGKKYGFNFILSHPMAGSEESGFDASEAELFLDSKWLINKNNKTLEKIIKDLGAIPLKTDMEVHDLMCAKISHLPSILSVLLFDLADDNSKLIASSGFRDTTRLAMSNSSLLLGMIKNNEKNIEKTLNDLVDKFNYLKNLSDNEKINLFKSIAQKRAQMYNKNGKNIFKI